MNMKLYTIMGDPVAWARATPNFHMRRLWDSQKELKMFMRIDLARQHGDLPFFSGPIKFDAVFHMPLSRVIKAKYIDCYHHSKPDVDNLLKLLLDTTESVLFQNDCEIAQISGLKVYSTNPRTEFTITQLPLKYNIGQFDGKKD